ncbi:MAG: hypothetical protein JO297_12150 [Nitrososphaeraceae archaeon]|nr:hypothetical protein [Nitrososphaeraceae archaeon]
MLQQTFDLAAEKVSNLYKGEYWLEQSIASQKKVIRNNIKIKSIAEQVVNGFLTEQRPQLTSAIMVDVSFYIFISN